MSRRAAGALLAALLLAATARAEEVRFAGGDGALLAAHWLPAAVDGPRPAIVALHGCGGLYRRDGRTLAARYTDYAERLHRAGYHVLLPDSFGSRGSGPICTIRSGERTIGAATRRADALAAVQWLARQPDVDARRIVLLGWSHGGSAVLNAVNDAAPGGAAAVASAVAFYPGCSALLKQAFRLQTPLLLLLGANDDWTPPAPCERLVERTRRAQPAAAITLRVYADSYHGFDGTAPLRLRSDVPNGVDRAGVHQGGNPTARAAALQELERFLAPLAQPAPAGAAAPDAPAPGAGVPAPEEEQHG